MAVKKILIVDDAELDRITLKNILGDEFEVLEADNGYSALKLIPKEGRGIDAIILDICMPIYDGFSVLEHMKKNNIHGIPVFMITSEATSENVEKAAQYNISGFIRKPFDREDVYKRLKARLG